MVCALLMGLAGVQRVVTIVVSSINLQERYISIKDPTARM